MRFFRTSPEKLPAAESEMIFSKQDLKQLLLPLLAEQFLVVLIGMMDTIMVSYCGESAMSGVSLVDSINVLLIGVFSALATGGAVLVSQYLGQKRPDAAKTAAKMLFYVVLLVSLAIMAVCLIFRKPLLFAIFGNVEEDVMTASQIYFLMSALSYPVMAIYNAYCALLRCIGNPRATMFSSFIMNIVNLIGNSVTIFWLGWGVMGAAVATVAGQVITAAMGVWYLCHTKALRLGKDDFKLRGEILAAYLPLGLCSFLAQISLVIAMAATNNMLVQYGAGSKYGADIPLTVLGIVMKVFQIIISITIGMSAGCIPIVGYNYGAEQYGRCRGILWRLMGAEFALGVLALLVTQLFPRQLIGLFGAESALYNEFAVLTFRVYLCMLPLATVNKAAFIFMQALGRPVESAGLSFFREVLLAVPLAFGLMGVLYSMPAADIVTFLASAFVLVRTDRQLRK